MSPQRHRPGTGPGHVARRPIKAVHRVVVVGHGMVAARFVEELDRRVGERVDVTVLGAEPYLPYNRLLLSEVLGGRADIAGLTLPEPPAHVTVLTAATATSLHRSDRVVCDELGGRHHYDTLVLATGAAARVPPLAGLPPEAVDDPASLPPGVRTLRSIDDCRDLLAVTAGSTAPRALRVTVLGGGLLGLEAALGLASRGAEVTVVHSGTHVLDRQIDAASGSVVRQCLRDLRVRLLTRARAARVELSEGRLRALQLTDGRRLETDLLLLTAGVVPRTDLARSAGLTVKRGVAVGEDLRSPDDPRVAAIGDCAEPPTGCPGLLAPGWAQAASLADDIAGRVLRPDTCGDAPSGGAPVLDEPGDSVEDPGEVIRLKAAGLDVVSFGRCPADHAVPGDDVPVPAPGTPDDNVPDEAAEATRVLALVDVSGRRSLRLAVRQDRLVGGVLVGAGALAADLIVAFERGTPVPADPAHLLLKGGGRGVPVAENPAHIPGGATICRCNGVTKSAIVGAFTGGERTLERITSATRATTGCGGCRAAVTGLVEWLHDVDPEQEPTPGARRDTSVRAGSAPDRTSVPTGT